jgi:hypothetical protein
MLYRKQKQNKSQWIKSRPVTMDASGPEESLGIQLGVVIIPEHAPRLMFIEDLDRNT